MFYTFAYWLSKLIGFLLGGIKYIGRENIPEEKSFIAAANHRSNLDPFLVGLGMDRQMAFVAKESLFDKPVIKRMLQWVNAYPINRNGDPREVIEKTVEILKKGKPITIFPEGTRNKVDDSLGEFKKGAALIAIKAQVPIIPVAIKNPSKIFGKKIVIYGKAIIPPKEENKYNREQLTNELKESIESLLYNHMDIVEEKMYERGS